MIIGIGTDLVSVIRIKACLDRHGERFAQRILAEEELVEFVLAKHQANFLAKRFAAKEAVAKAIGVGFSQGLRMRDIRIAHNASGKPLLLLTGRAMELCQQLGVIHSHVSLSDEHDYALAFVILSA